MEHSRTSSNPAAQALARLRLRKTPRPILSDYAATLLEHAEQPDREDLMRLIALDPLMAVWILKRANSSFYGMRSTVDGLSRAFDVLEEGAIAGMFAETFGAENLNGNEPPAPQPDTLTRHSIATALLSAKLATGSASARSFAFTAGLLHDIGKHVFLLNYPDEALRIYDATTLWDSLAGADLASVEKLAFGINHLEVGEFVARKMQFPESIVDVLRAHADPSILPPSSDSFRMASVVQAASLAATALGYAAGDSVSWEQCTSHGCWGRLVEAELTGHGNTGILLADIADTVDTIDEFLEFEVNRSATLMKTASRPKRKNRQPVQARKFSGRGSADRGRHIQSQS